MDLVFLAKVFQKEIKHEIKPTL